MEHAIVLGSTMDDAMIDSWSSPTTSMEYAMGTHGTCHRMAGIRGLSHGVVHGWHYGHPLWNTPWHRPWTTPWCRPWTMPWRRLWRVTMDASMDETIHGRKYRFVHERCHGHPPWNSPLHRSWLDGSMDTRHGTLHGIVHGRTQGVVHGRTHGVDHRTVLE